MRWLDKLTDAASENLHVVRQTPWAFGICLLALLIPICALIYSIDDARMDAKYSGTIASKDALIAHLENQLSTRPLPTSELRRSQQRQSRTGKMISFSPGGERESVRA